MNLKIDPPGFDSRKRLGLELHSEPARLAPALFWIFSYLVIFQFRIEYHFDRLVCLEAVAPRTFVRARTWVSGPLPSLRLRRYQPTCLRSPALWKPGLE